jgi:hypothetical protein
MWSIRLWTTQRGSRKPRSRTRRCIHETLPGYEFYSRHPMWTLGGRTFRGEAEVTNSRPDGRRLDEA